MRPFPIFEKLLTFETECAIVPIPKQSTAFGRGHSYTPKRQADYVKKLKRHFNSKFPYKGLFEGPIHIQVLFVFPAKGKAKKEKLGDRGWYPHTTVPDKDNLIKPVFDAMTGTVWKDDKYVFRKDVMAVYSTFAKIVVSATLCKIPKISEYRLH